MFSFRHVSRVVLMCALMLSTLTYVHAADLTGLVDSVLPPPTPQPAEKPTGFFARDDGNKVTLVWDLPTSSASYILTVQQKSNTAVQCLKPTSGAADAISFYSYLVRSGFSDWDCTNEVVIPKIEADYQSYAIRGLVRAVPYVFTLTAKNNVGPSIPVTAVGGVDMGGLQPPTNLNFTSFGKGIGIMWTPSANAKVTGYALRIQNDLTGAPVCFAYNADAGMVFTAPNAQECGAVEVPVDLTNPLIQVGGLTEYDMYRFSVFATDGSHFSESADKLSLVLIPGNGALTLKWRQSENFDASKYTLWSEQQLCIANSIGSGSVSGIGCANSQTITPVNDATHTGIKTYVLRGLTNGTKYHLAVNDPLVQSAQKSPGSPAPVAAVIAAREEGGASAAISWEAPDTTSGGGDPAGYALTVRRNGEAVCLREVPGEGSVLQVTTGSACRLRPITPYRLGDTFYLTYKIEGLDKNTAYSVEIATWNDVGYAQPAIGELPVGGDLTAWGQATVGYAAKWADVITRKGFFRESIDNLWNQAITITDPKNDTRVKTVQYPYLGGKGSFGLYEVGGHYHCGGNRAICGVNVTLSAPVSKTVKLTAPDPGVFTHCSTNFNGQKGCGTIKYDPVPPTLISHYDAADTDDGVNVIFDDNGLSGVAKATFVIVADSGIAETATWTPPNGVIQPGQTVFQVPVAKLGVNTIKYDVCDQAKNCSTGEFKVKVFAGSPFWGVSDDCAVSREFSCIALDATTRVADDADKYAARIELRDRYGNPIVPTTGEKSVTFNLSFTNANYLDQIKKTGDPAHYVATGPNTNALDQRGGASVQLIAKPNATGVYDLDIRSFSPTSSGYLPIWNDGFKFVFETVAIDATYLGTYASFGVKNTTHAVLHPYRDLAFTAALSPIPALATFDTTSRTYIPMTSGEARLKVGVAQRFILTLTNQSASKVMNETALGVVADASADEVRWSDGLIEKAAGSDANVAFMFDDQAPFDSIWNTMPSASQRIASATYITAQLRATPVRGGVKGTGDPIFDAYASYAIDGTTVRHRGYGLWTHTAEELQKSGGGGGSSSSSSSSSSSTTTSGSTSAASAVPMQNIQIIGAVHTTTDSVGINAGEQLNQSIGDVQTNEVKAAIAKNVAGFLRNPDVKKKACRLGSYTLGRTWDDLSCRFSNGDILYFDHTDVTIDDPSGTLVLPSGAHTLLIVGGNLHIKSNLVYPGKGHTFGIVLLRDDNKNDNPLDDGGNVYVYPSVVNVASAVYAEGAAVSVNASGSATIADRTKELNNQLYWEGLLISSNTIGGALQTPAVCPPALQSACTAATGGDTTRMRSLAKVFDLNYLRTFQAETGGRRAGRNLPTKQNPNGTINILLTEPPGGVSNNATLILKYDGRIVSNPPPLFSVIKEASSTQSGR